MVFVQLAKKKLFLANCSDIPHDKKEIIRLLMMIQSFRTIGKKIFNYEMVILAGGRGTRLSELTHEIPKPMVKVNGKPILVHLINHYKKFGIKEFIIAAGYKKEVINNFFKKGPIKGCDIKVVNTGINTMTGGRIKRLKSYLFQETFLMTYGDGLSDIDINKLIRFHKKHKKIGTLTAVRPPARFGAIKISSKKTVTYFKEKSDLDEGWVNGGFFVLEPKF